MTLIDVTSVSKTFWMGAGARHVLEDVEGFLVPRVGSADRSDPTELLTEELEEVSVGNQLVDAETQPVQPAGVEVPVESAIEVIRREVREAREGRCQNKDAARAEQPAKFTERLNGRLEMLEHLDTHDGVERPVRLGDLRDVANDVRPRACCTEYAGVLDPKS